MKVQNGSRFGSACLNIFGTQVKRRIPADRLPSLAGPDHGVENAVRTLETPEVALDFRAREPRGHRMRRISLDLNRTASIFRHNERTGVRTVQCARRNFVH
jgi:hypothetical protein